jgi:tetratricopeptide (TPR) repeat protein
LPFAPDLRLLATAWLVLCAACGAATQAAAPSVKALPAVDPRAEQKFRQANIELASNAPGATDRAKRALGEAIALDKHLWEAHYNLGVVLRRGGQLRQAAAEFEAARAIQPGAKEPLYALAEAHDALAEHDQAATLLTEYLHLRPEDADVRVALGTLLRTQGRYDEALEQARLVLVRNPDNVRALLEVGRVYRERGELDVAELVFDRARQKNEKLPAPYHELGLVALGRGDTQAAFDHFDAAVRADRHFAPARLSRAAVLVRAGDYKAAEAEYRRVLDQDETQTDARVGLGIALRGQGQHAAAEAEYSRVLAREQNHLAALYDLVVVMWEFEDKRAETKPYLDRILATASAGPTRAAAERYLADLGKKP